jgi:hypothetical protein
MSAPAKKLHGLLAIPIEGKASKAPERDEEGGADSSMEKEYALDAFAAVKDDDPDAFAEAFSKAVEACVRRQKDGDYSDEEG